jgi:hypothetical protein
MTIVKVFSETFSIKDPRSTFYKYYNSKELQFLPMFTRLLYETLFRQVGTEMVRERGTKTNKE